jgi:hypothetical protein
VGRANGRNTRLLLRNLQGRGGRLYNSVSRNLREEMSIYKFKEGAKKRVREQIPVRPRR